MDRPVTWDRGRTSGLISLPTGQHVFVSVSGPDRQKNQPIILIIPGVACSITEWVVVRRLLQQTSRVLVYERSGMGASEESPLPRTASNLARELNTLLQVLRIGPPYVIVCHSYGGIIAREFVELRREENKPEDGVAGIVFVEANQEKSIALWPDPDLEAMSKGINWYDTTGLEMDRALTDSEWKAVTDERNSIKHQRAAEREMEHYIGSCMALGAKSQLGCRPPFLGNHPISVLQGYPEKDLRRVFEVAVERGNGSTEQRQRVENKLKMYPELNEKFQREILTLSTQHRYSDVKDCGHSIHIVEPEAISDEVEWVLNRLLITKET
ncbi:hypothetical protein N7462_001409 [Penicillium macrosclerotiorum]|uniref:uncharacterized protein n=1 Tax=Penicillium macrosclerotiorum TaxID=303699 RepID=UPI002546A3FD|nr:uncharacterized protein N7462_001409 [Penicillium macrosclerotiorum]KAJ5691986.1 hypothetical protein N7462_001409 [Penicillium macrosclerotiorum]